LQGHDAGKFFISENVRGYNFNFSGRAESYMYILDLYDTLLFQDLHSIAEGAALSGVILRRRKASAT